MEIGGIFEKVFILKNENQVHWQLPEIKLGSENQHLKDDKVENLKTELNTTKASLNNFEIEDWNKHTTYCNPASNVTERIRHYFRPELCTQAWCKFHEILCLDQVLPDFALSSKLVGAVHLCEAPGAFICSLNHYLKSRYENIRYRWLACTLNPYYEGNDPDSCVSDDRMIFRSYLRWCFGPDNTGDIFSKSLFEDLSKRAANECGRVCLVTADGSFNCQKNPAQQEMDTSRLKYTELLYALKILDSGGSFVLKIFTPLEYTSIQLLYILCCTFEYVAIRKPATSKPGNSELYVVAKGYKKLDTEHTLLIALRQLCLEGNDPAPLDLFSTNALPNDFVTKYKSCVETFVQYQINAIKYNIEKYDERDSLDLDELHNIVVRMAFKKMGIWFIPYDQCIIKDGALRRSTSSNIDLRPKLSGTFIARRLFVRITDFSFQRYFTWTTYKRTQNECGVRPIFGKPLCTIRTSLFCDTRDLMALDHPERVDTFNIIDRDDETAKLSALRKYVQEMICSANGQVYEPHLLSNGKAFSELVGLTGPEGPHFSPLKISPAVILGKDSLLLASFLQSTFELDVAREIKCMHILMNLVVYVLHNSRPGANMVLILPSYPMLLKMVLQFAAKTPKDRVLLGILPRVELLQDTEFVDLLKDCNHAVVRALQRRLHAHYVKTL